MISSSVAPPPSELTPTKATPRDAQSWWMASSTGIIATQGEHQVAQKSSTHHLAAQLGQRHRPRRDRCPAARTPARARPGAWGGALRSGGRSRRRWPRRPMPDSTRIPMPRQQCAPVAGGRAAGGGGAAGVAARAVCGRARSGGANRRHEHEQRPDAGDDVDQRLAEHAHPGRAVHQPRDRAQREVGGVAGGAEIEIARGVPSRARAPRSRSPRPAARPRRPPASRRAKRPARRMSAPDVGPAIASRTRQSSGSRKVKTPSTTSQSASRRLPPSASTRAARGPGATTVWPIRAGNRPAGGADGAALIARPGGCDRR